MFMKSLSNVRERAGGGSHSDKPQSYNYSVVSLSSMKHLSASCLAFRACNFNTVMGGGGLAADDYRSNFRSRSVVPPYSAESTKG